MHCTLCACIYERPQGWGEVALHNRAGFLARGRQSFCFPSRQWRTSMPATGGTLERRQLGRTSVRHSVGKGGDGGLFVLFSYFKSSDHFVTKARWACLLCHAAGMCLAADMSGVSHSRHVCRVAQQTSLLRHTADMSVMSHSRHVCCVTQQPWSAV